MNDRNMLSYEIDYDGMNVVQRNEWSQQKTFNEF